MRDLRYILAVSGSYVLRKYSAFFAFISALRSSLYFLSYCDFKERFSSALLNFRRAIPEQDRPLLWIDIGDADKELLNVAAFEEKLTGNNYIHEFHRYSGDHTENYWGSHVEEYLRWYAGKWREKPLDQ